MWEFDSKNRGRGVIFLARGTECIKTIAVVMLGLVPGIPRLSFRK
jgi:hypothetical protein